MKLTICVCEKLLCFIGNKQIKEIRAKCVFIRHNLLLRQIWYFAIFAILINFAHGSNGFPCQRFRVIFGAQVWFTRNLEQNTHDFSINHVISAQYTLMITNHACFYLCLFNACFDPCLSIFLWTKLKIEMNCITCSSLIF